MVVVMVSLVWWGKASSTDTEWLKVVWDISNVLCLMQVPPAVHPSAMATTSPRVNWKCKAPEIENPNTAVICCKQPWCAIQ